MNKIYKSLTVVGIFFLFFTMARSVAYSAGGAYGGQPYGGNPCVPVYGGGTSCARVEETVDKMVYNPLTKQFVDGLGPDHDIRTRFQPDQEVLFRIQVRNAGDQMINRVQVTDTIPPYTEFVSGPGSFDSTTRLLTYAVDNLKSGEVNEQFFKVKVVSADRLPGQGSLFCGREGIKNVVTIQADGRTPKSDETPFCIGKPGAPIETPKIPSAGVEDVILPALTAFMGMGIYFSKWSRRGKSTK